MPGVVIPNRHGQHVEPFQLGRPGQVHAQPERRLPGFDGSQVTRNRGVSSACRRCMSGTAVVAAAATHLAEDRSDRRAYQTAPTVPRADTIATTCAAISMISLHGIAEGYRHPHVLA